MSERASALGLLAAWTFVAVLELVDTVVMFQPRFQQDPAGVQVILLGLGFLGIALGVYASAATSSSTGTRWLGWSTAALFLLLGGGRCWAALASPHLGLQASLLSILPQVDAVRLYLLMVSIHLVALAGQLAWALFDIRARASALRLTALGTAALVQYVQACLWFGGLFGSPSSRLLCMVALDLVSWLGSATMLPVTWCVVRARPREP